MDKPFGPKYPGGCYIFFNGSINQRGVEQLVLLASQAIRNRFNRLTICMSSSGGDTESALYAYNALSSLPLPLVMHNVGAVMSAAVTVFLAGTERYANPGATMFFHQTASGYDGSRMTEAFLLAKLSFVKREDERTAQIIAEKTGRTVQRVNEWQRTELLMNNATAQAEGLIHEERALAIPPDGWPVQVVAS